MASNSIIQYASSSSSSSSRENINTYHVFVSFCGDTRNNFTDHLFGALHIKDIHYFKDDTKLDRGKHILPELLQAIDGSQILVVVFSTKYASSEWCLREVEKIVSCKKESGKHVLPIFYDVTPSEVKKQSGKYKEAFDEYEERFKADKEMMEEVLRWRQALSLVGHLSGWEIGNKPQHGEIEKIVQHIKEILEQNVLCSWNDDFVGIKSRVEELENLLLLGSDDVVMTLGIYGGIGMGKTTLVTTLYDRIRSNFHAPYFIEDVNNSCHDIYKLRNKLLYEDPKEKNSSKIVTLFCTNLVSHGRRLIVLDNVGHIEQLEKLNLNHKYLSPGSRIIIISRDGDILERCGIYPIYHVQPLNYDNADQLFCKHAFKGKGNSVRSEYKKLKYELLSYLQGHPLLIKVLGRHLADEDLSQWSNALHKLRENPKKDIFNKLRISFDGLEQCEKEIFLDIACFHGWFQRQNIMEVLRSRIPEAGLKSLFKKSLITYYDARKVEMPSLLIDLGRYIVKEKSPKKPRKWSRLWDSKDLLDVVLDKKESNNLETIIVDDCSSGFLNGKKTDALSKMSQLKLLILIGVNFVGNLNDLCDKLEYLIWNGYSFKCLPSNFQPNNLIRLVMNYSKVKRLWKGRKVLPNLKHLDLSFSYNITEMPNFEEAPNLEMLNFEGCCQLRKIHSSIRALRKLTFLNLKYCRSVDKMPDFGEASNLEELSFEGCLELKEIHHSIGSLKKLRALNLQGCKTLVSLPTSLLEVSSVEYLNLSGCSNLHNIRLLEEPWLAKHFKKPCKGEAPVHLQPTSSFQEKSFMPCLLLSLPSFPHMWHLDLSFCNLHQIPDTIGNLCCLQKLYLKGNKFEKLPSMKKLSKLVYINLEHCKKLKYLFELPSQTEFTAGPVFRLRGGDHWRERGLNMFNCPKIVGSEEWSISWLIQLIKAEHHQQKSLDYRPSRSIDSVIPGNGIPRWFNKQPVDIGKKIRADGSPLGQDDNNWIGVAFCVVFCVSPHLKKHFTDGPQRDYSHRIMVYPDVDPVTKQSDHMCLFYFTRSFWGEINCDKLGEYFEITAPCWEIEVKKYRYRWIYESDLHLSNISSNHCKNKSNRKPKYLEI